MLIYELVSQNLAIRAYKSLGGILQEATSTCLAMSRRGFVRSGCEAEPLATGSLTFNRWPYTHPGRAGAHTQHLYPFSAPDPTAFLQICAMQDCKRPLVKRSHNILWKHSSGGCLILNHTECCGPHTQRRQAHRAQSMCRDACQHVQMSSLPIIFLSLPSPSVRRTPNLGLSLVASVVALLRLQTFSDGVNSGN